MKLSNAKNIGGAVALLVGAAVLMPDTNAHATVKSLTDGNSVAWIDLDSSAGMYEWTVDGINHLNQQWFWYRVGSGAQSPINAISTAAWSQSAANSLTTTYANANFGVEVYYSLTGGGSGIADIDEGIRVFNYTANPLNLSFYQYSDFNLLDTAGNDQVEMDNSLAVQWKGLTQIAEGIVAPTASAFEANYTGGITSTLYKLGNVNNLVLDNTPSAGPGDVTWSFQWDLTIPAYSWESITKDKLLNVYVVPEPSALALGALGCTLLLLCWRRDSSKRREGGGIGAVENR